MAGFEVITEASTPKRRVFISFDQQDRAEVESFIYRWEHEHNVFTSRALQIFDDSDFINSNNSDYVMRRIRQDYLGDSTVTILLIGSCTHSRRYVDWELKASLRQGGVYTPNGLIGLVVRPNRAVHVPDRFAANRQTDNVSCYARFYAAPAAADRLADWIEDAYEARSTRRHLITNGRDMMKYNGKCRLCGYTH